MSDSFNPMDYSLLGSSVHGILQARTLEWVAISLSNAWKWKVKVQSLSRVWLLATPWTAAHQAPPSMGFARQEQWSGMPLPSPTFTHYPVPNPLSHFFWYLLQQHPTKRTDFESSHPFCLHTASHTFYAYYQILPIPVPKYLSNQPTFPHLGTNSLVFSFPGGTRDKEPICQCRRHKRHGFDPWLGRFPGGEHGNPHQFLAWRIPWTEKPGGLQSIGSQRVRYDWSNLKRHTALFKLLSICDCVWVSYGWCNKLPQTE